MSFYLVVQSGFFSDLLLFGLGFFFFVFGFLFGGVWWFFYFVYVIFESQTNSLVSMGSLVWVQLRSSSQWQLFNRTICGLFQISDKYTCITKTQKHGLIHCHSYQKRKQIYRMYKLNLSFQYYFPTTLVRWDILD